MYTKWLKSAWKKKAQDYKQCLQETEDIAIDAVEEGYAPKNSPAEHKFKQIANRIHYRLHKSFVYEDV